MEMEHINENLIKVYISVEDLEDRGIDFLNLIGNQDEIEKFFHTILEEVDVDHQFQSSEAVTFQVMPKTDGLELYISKSSADELDDFWTDEITRLIREDRSRTRNTSSSEHPTPKEHLSVDEILAETSQQPQLPTSKTIAFEKLADFIHVAREIPTDLFQADLYEMSGRYFLVLSNLDDNVLQEQGLTFYLKLLEYGEEYVTTEAILQEHGQLLHEHNALQFFGENF